MQDIIYEEKLWSKELMGISLLIMTAFLVLLIYQVTKGPIGNNPAPNWFYFSLFLLFLGTSIIFSTLTVKITSKNIDVGYSFIRFHSSWQNIENCYLDVTPTFWYGGWGIRLAKIDNKWRLIYNVIGTPRVVISLSKGRCREFAFSTRSPEKIIKLIKEQLYCSPRKVDQW